MVPTEAHAILSNNKPDIAGVRWLNPEKYHITFEYFAELSHDLLPDVRRKVHTLSELFPLHCEANCFSGFPSYHTARVIIALISLAEPKIHELCDNKRFKPHVTVGYARNRVVFVPQNPLQLAFAFVRPALFRSQNGVYSEITTDEL